MREMSEDETWHRVSALCSLSEHCLSEISDKMDKWAVPKDAQLRILKKLVEEKYIDEERYCKSFVHDKFVYNKWGKMKINKELRSKKISLQCIESQLDQIEESEYLNVLKSLLQVKKKTVRGKSEYEINGKLIRFALGRGFEMDIIRLCLNAGVYEGTDS